MKRLWTWAWVLPLVALASNAPPQGIGGLFDRIGDRVAKKFEDRMSGTGEKMVDKTFDRTDRAVDCATGDAECVRDANRDGEAVAARSPSAKCVATDVPCLKTAKARGQTVEIVADGSISSRASATGETYDGCLAIAAMLARNAPGSCVFPSTTSFCLNPPGISSGA